ncbi:MAG: hypothetical protein AB9869_21040 [Verrucomicrobiia bacterium]
MCCFLRPLGILGIAAVTLHGALADPNADLSLLRERLCAALTPESASERARVVDEAQAAIKKLLPNGSWGDIDYSNRDAANWDAVRHLSRTRTMARCLRILPSPDKAEPIKAALWRALDHWLTQNYRNPNWWWNDIGAPTSLAETSLLLAPDFQSPEQLAQADRNLDSKRWNQLTGQNLVWMTKIRILRGCLLNNEEMARGGFERLWQEIFIAPIGQEGVQADGSFHQHGNVLYTGGYGQGFATDLAHLAACAEGTPFAIPEARRNILSSYVLDG